MSAAMLRVQSDWKKIGDLIKKLRNCHGFTRKELAIAAGLSEDLIKKYESGKIPITIKSLSRLTKILGPIEDNHSYDFQTGFNWTLTETKSYNLDGLLNDLQIKCNKDGGILSYYYLSLGADVLNDYFSVFQNSDYNKIIDEQLLALPNIAFAVEKLSKSRNIHMICLTCGHGWIEYSFALAIANRTDMQIIMEFIHPSEALLLKAIDQFKKVRTKFPNISVHAHLGSYNDIISALMTTRDRNLWQRVICAFGTLNNYDFDIQLLQFLHNICADADLLLLDTINRCHQEEEEVKIQRADPSLNGNAPLWAKLTEQNIEHVLRRQVQRPAAISIAPTFASQKRFPLALGDYAVELVATIDDGIRRPWRISGFRCYRQSVNRVVELLASIGWRLVQRQDCGQVLGPPYLTSLLLFMRREGS